MASTVSASIPDQIRQTNRRFEELVWKKQFDQIGSVYTRDARALPPGAAMVTGREQIQSFWQQAIPSLGVETVRLNTLDLAIAGDTAYEVGEAELATAQPASPTRVKYVVVWKYEEGAWLWHVDIWNAANQA